MEAQGGHNIVHIQKVICHNCCHQKKGAKKNFLQRFFFFVYAFVFLELNSNQKNRIKELEEVEDIFLSP